MRAVRPRSIGVLLALGTLAVSVAPAGASTRAVELGVTEPSAGHGLWLPFVLVVALALVSLPAMAPGWFGKTIASKGR